MATTTKNGYKRIMGEIPVKMHEKITRYNKISDRPLNVSKAIELCMSQAIKKIDDELVYDAESEGGCGTANDAIYEPVKKDIEEGELNAIGIYEHFIEVLEKESPLDDITMKMTIYPIDNVEINESGKIIFSAKGVRCISLISLNYLDKHLEKSRLHKDVKDT